jgi:hypothetical protein
MSSVDEFPTRIERLDDVPERFREALSTRIPENEAVIDLMFSPVYRAGKFSSLASVLCVTENRWLVVLLQEDGRITVDTAPYEATLLSELTIILLYGALKIDFVSDGQLESTALQFNAVMIDNYWHVLQDILDKIDDNVECKTDSNWRESEVLSNWPIKFRNVSNIYAPRGSRLLDGVQWGDIYGRFHRYLAPAAALLLTDRHLIVIAEEKPAGWFQFRARTHYGQIITYFPLDRLASFRVSEHARFDILKIEGHDGHGGETFEIKFHHDQADAIKRLMKEASFAPCMTLVNRNGSNQ